MDSIFFLGMLLLCISANDVSQALTTVPSNATSSSITTITKSSPSDVTTNSPHVINMVSSSTSFPSYTSSYAYTASLETIANSVTSSQHATVNTTETFAASSTKIAESVTTAVAQVSPSVTPLQASESVTSFIAKESVTFVQAGVNATSIHTSESVTSVIAKESVTSVQAAANATSVQFVASVTSIHASESVKSVHGSSIFQFTTIAATPTPKITESPTFSPLLSTTSVTKSTTVVDSSVLPSSPTFSSSELTSPTATTVTSPSVTTTIQPSSVTLSTDSVTSTALPTTQLPTTTPRPNAPPRIKAPTEPIKEEKEGNKILLKCQVTAGYPTPTITWKKDGKAIQNAIFKFNNSIMIIEKMSRDDAGKYTCIAKNRFGKDGIEVQVKIYYLSNIFITFSANPAKEGSTIEVTCSTQSSPRPVLRWEFLGERGIPSSIQAHKGNQTYVTNFTLRNVKRKLDAGMYTCIGTNIPADIEARKIEVLEIEYSTPPTYPPATKLLTTHDTIVVPVHNIEYLKNGKKVKYVQIIVFELKDGTLPDRSPSSYTKLGSFKDDRLVPYIAAVFKVNEKQDFTIGDGLRYSVTGKVRRNVNGQQEYENVPLQPDKYYTAFQRIVSADFDNNSLPWIPPTKTGHPPTKHIPHDNKGLIVGIVIAVIIVLIVVAIVVKIYIKYHQSPSIGNRDKYEMNGISPLGKMARTFSMHMARINEHYHTPEPIPIEEFPHHVMRMHKSGDMLFSTEYERIYTRDDNTIPATHCLDPENQHKNRYTNVVAYDHNRVKLIPFDDEPASDYINASYIGGYQGMTYIAAQGPLDETCGDYWRMIWEQNTKVIVMLTNVRERGRPKCSQYWPTSGSCKFESAHVSLDEEVELTSHTIRVFRVTMANQNETRVIKHFHFTSWPDHGVPKSVAFLLAFVRETAKANPPDAGPMVVHCSAGVGRTGTFIVIDSMLKQIVKENTIDVFHFVIQIRKQRNLMVQTEQQYIFLHDALLDAVVSGDTEIHVNRFRQHVEEMLEHDKEGDTKLTNEFQRLTRGVRPHLLRAAANHSANKRKNRYANNLPYDETRVSLSVHVAVVGSDYINACYIDGYRRKQAYIATQAPLPQTFVDFWRMIWEQESCTIVTLAQEVENTKPKMDRYWPTSHPITYGNLEVEFLEEEKKELFDIRVFNIKNIQDETSRTVHQYHYMDWTSEDIDDSGSHLLAMIDAIQQWQDTSGNHVITVHCSAGVGRTGVFCAVTSLIERLRAESLVDVFMAVKLLREQRPAMVQTKIQYEYCYRILLQYLDINKSLEERDSSLDVIQNIITVKPLENEAEINHVLPADTSDHAQEEQTPEETTPELTEEEPMPEETEEEPTPEETEEEPKNEETRDEEKPDEDDSETGHLRIDSMDDSDPYILPLSSTFAVNT